MKQDQLKNIQQKQLLINRLYKSKNNPSANKTITKPEDTKLLFYVLFLSYFSKRKKNLLKNKKLLAISFLN